MRATKVFGVGMLASGVPRLEILGGARLPNYCPPQVWVQGISSSGLPRHYLLVRSIRFLLALSRFL